MLGLNYNVEEEITVKNKYLLLNACFEELGHCVPNSDLFKINNIAKIIEFYKTPVKTITPYEELKKQNLPPNLHVQQDYVRFTEDTSDYFKGITAFPKSSTIVTSLKYKSKYKGYKADPINNAPFDKEGHYKG